MLVAFGLLGCSTYNPIQLSPSPQALAQCQEKREGTASIQLGVEPSEAELCLLEVLRPRCDAVDTCLVDCITSGEGQNVGGGCFHLCEWVATGVKGKLYKCPQEATPEWCACLGLERNCGDGNAPPPSATRQETP